jgi:glycosyltransferase involved in cell wall biosynthesis
MVTVMFSVVIPAYNEAPYLPRSLSSLRQAALTLEDVFPDEESELIVVNNCSTDDTAAVARRFGATVVDEEKRGIAIARNAGARIARGDLLVFVDADYRVLPSFLTRLARAYRANPAMVAAGVRVLLEPCDIDPIARSICHFCLTLLRRFKNMSFGIATFRRACFEALGGFDEGLFCLEDVEILERLKPRASELGRYGILSDVLVFASARGFYRGGVLGMGQMLGTYTRMAFFPAARTDMTRCSYWYERL